MRGDTGDTLASISERHKVQDMPSHVSTACSAKRILLVENEEGQRLLYEQELNEEGYDVIWARNGREALTRLEESLCDLVILDIVMPEMDGIEVLGKIVSRYKKVPVILHTAYAHYQNNFMTWLADAFVLKSPDLSVLKKTVKQLMRKHEEEKDNQRLFAQESRGSYERRP